MRERSTQPTKVEGVGDALPSAWQPEEISWSFGPTQRQMVGWNPNSPSRFEVPNSQNQNGPSTTGPQEIRSPDRRPTVVLARDFGRRGFATLAHWEGVVDEVNGETFRCRLIPLGTPAPEAAEIEFTQFSLDELSSEDDRALVKPGAVFYWTIGKGRNAAGTLTNVSLVRLRRLPGSTTQHQRAEREAEDLLTALGNADGSEPTGP